MTAPALVPGQSPVGRRGFWRGRAQVPHAVQVRVLELYDAGATFAEIEDDTGVPPGTAAKIRDRHGRPHRIGRPGAFQRPRPPAPRNIPRAAFDDGQADVRCASCRTVYAVCLRAPAPCPSCGATREAA